MGNSEEILELVYDRLRNFAKSRFTQNDSLFGTELVHEAWLRLGSEKTWDSESHFFGAVRNAMRNATADYLRKRNASKRGGNNAKVSMEVLDLESPSQLPEIISLSDALDELEKHDQRSANVVTLKFFACMTEEEISNELNVSRKTVTRDWAYAKLWLQNHMKET